MECVGRAADFRDGKMVKVHLSGHKHSRDALLVVRVGDRFYAIENACAHKDAKLHRGDIEDLGNSVNAAVGDGSPAGGLCVRCPKHQRKFCGGLWFSLATGKSFIDGHSRKYDPKWRQATHATEVRSDGNLYVSVAPVNWRTIRDAAKEEAATAAATKAHDRGHAAIGLSQPAKTPTSTATAVVGVQDKPVEVPEWSPWQLTSVKQYSHDTAVFTFVPALSSSDGAAAAALAKAQRRAATVALANRTSWHLSLKLRYRNMVGLSRSVDREYTPVSDLAAWEAGRVDILIKVYPKGKLTSRLAKARIGDIMELGQLATTLPFPWLAPAATHAGAAAASNSSGAGGAGGGAGATTSAATATAAAAAAATPTHMLLIAGGTGIAPMWQLCHALLSSPRPSWPASLLLLCSNRTPGDVLLHKELAALQQKHKSQLRVVHTITGGTAAKGAWAGEVGRITVDMLRKYVKPGTVASSAAVVSGPEGMWPDMRDALLKLGYTPQRMHELEA